MTNTLSRVFRTIGNNSLNGTTRHLPMFNEITSSLDNYFNTTSQTARKRALMNWYKSIPELTGLINKVARDISAHYHFEPVDKRGGRNRVLKAEKFATDVSYRRIKFSQAVDKLVTGESFGWLGRLTKDKIQDHAKKFLQDKGFNSIENKGIYNHLLSHIESKQFADEDLIHPKLYQYIASSTMEIVYNNYIIEGYYQHVGARPREFFSPEEIIRGTFMEVDGKVNGFTSVESVIVQLELLRFMWQNMVSLQRNGGYPDKIFILEEETNSRAYERIRQQLQKYQLVENKHGNMLFTGKVKIEELQQLDKMQFMDMGLYITGLIAMQWGIPRSSIPYIVGGTNTKDDTGGNSEKGYWDNIEYAQELDAEIDNTQLWIPYFGVRLVPDKAYVQKDVQGETAKQLLFNNVKLLEDLAMQSGKKLKFDDKVKMLGLRTDMFEDNDDDIGLVDSTLNNQLSNNQLTTSIDQRNKNDRKRDEQASTNNSNMKPTGTGKEESLDFDKYMEGKQLFDTPSEEVSFDKFIELYNEDKAYQSGKPIRVFMRQNDLFTTLKYKSTDFVYSTMIRNEELNPIMLSNIIHIYRL